MRGMIELRFTDSLRASHTHFKKFVLIIKIFVPDLEHTHFVEYTAKFFPLRSVGEERERKCKERSDKNVTEDDDD